MTTTSSPLSGGLPRCLGPGALERAVDIARDILVARITTRGTTFMDRVVRESLAAECVEMAVRLIVEANLYAHPDHAMPAQTIAGTQP